MGEVLLADGVLVASSSSPAEKVTFGVAMSCIQQLQCHSCRQLQLQATEGWTKARHRQGLGLDMEQAAWTHKMQPRSSNIYNIYVTMYSINNAEPLQRRINMKMGHDNITNTEACTCSQTMAIEKLFNEHEFRMQSTQLLREIHCGPSEDIGNDHPDIIATSLITC